MTSRAEITTRSRAGAAGTDERRAWTERGRELSLLTVHPGYVDAEVLDISTFSVIRARDLELVTAPSVLQMLDRSGVCPG